MQTREFQAAVESLLAWHISLGGSLAIMCAEAVFWRCHRQLIADALVVRGHTVWHITGSTAPAAHTLTSFARVSGESLRYPALWNSVDG